MFNYIECTNTVIEKSNCNIVSNLIAVNCEIPAVFPNWRESRISATWNACSKNADASTVHFDCIFLLFSFLIIRLLAYILRIKYMFKIISTSFLLLLLPKEFDNVKVGQRNTLKTNLILRKTETLRHFCGCVGWSLETAIFMSISCYSHFLFQSEVGFYKMVHCI